MYGRRLAIKEGEMAELQNRIEQFEKQRAQRQGLEKGQ
jgi:hypothetical protein